MEVQKARCSRCGAENEADTKFCGRCGSKFVPVEAPVTAGEDGLYYCYKHSKETTRVTCGRCERPICAKCLVVGPAGVRCKVCARNRTPVRIRGLAHGVGSTIGSNMTPNRVWYLYLWAMILRFIASLFGRW